MEAIGGLALIWLIHAAIALFVAGPVVYFGRHRVNWRSWELLILVLPFAVWTALMMSDLSTGRKSLSNLGEPFYFAFAIPPAAIVRVVLGQRYSEKLVSILLIALVSVMAIGVFFLVPALPE